MKYCPISTTFINPASVQNLLNLSCCDSSCHAVLPLFVRPMMATGNVSEDYLYYPEFNRSIVVSRWASMEEDGSISSTLDNRIATVFLVRHLHVLSLKVWFLWMSWQNLVSVVLLKLLIGLQNHPHSVLTHILRTAFLRFPAHSCSSPWPTYLGHEKFWPMSENCLCSQTWFWSQLRIYLAGNRL